MAVGGNAMIQHIISQMSDNAYETALAISALLLVWVVAPSGTSLKAAVLDLDPRLVPTAASSRSGEEYAMIGPKLMSAALLFVTAGSLTNAASAITVELAKKCETLTVVAFPPAPPGHCWQFG
jgi:hypothetical protein